VIDPVSVPSVASTDELPTTPSIEASEMSLPVITRLASATPAATSPIVSVTNTSPPVPPLISSE